MLFLVFSKLLKTYTVYALPHILCMHQRCLRLNEITAKTCVDLTSVAELTKTCRPIVQKVSANWLSPSELVAQSSVDHLVCLPDNFDDDETAYFSVRWKTRKLV